MFKSLQESCRPELAILLKRDFNTGVFLLAAVPAEELPILFYSNDTLGLLRLPVPLLVFICFWVNLLPPSLRAYTLFV